MIEIPNGKWCGHCILGHYSGDDWVCQLFDHQSSPWTERFIPCLSLYPNGATIKIEAKP